MLDFAKVPTPQIARSTFDRSHGYTTTLDADYIYPVLVDEILPSDTVNLDATFFVRINTLLHPIMDNLHFDLFAFFVPFRLVWENWQRFQGEQDNPDSTTDYLIPHLRGPDSDPTSMNFPVGSVFDYMTLPTERDIDTADEKISALYNRGYALIWNQWFRDENLQDSIVVPKGDGPDNYQQYTLLKRNKRKDMATAALPWQQKGDPVNLPLGTTAPVIGTGKGMGLFDGFTTFNMSHSYDAVGSYYRIAGNTSLTVPQDAGVTVPTGTGLTGPTLITGLSTDPNKSGVIADLTLASAVTINDLRTAIAVQQLRELYARGGTRYVELLRVEFGAISPDFRLQRAEYLAGSSKMMQISAVPQTSQSTEDGTPQANLSGYGTHSDRLSVRYNAVEHGMLFVLANVRPDIRYQQVLRKQFTRRTMLEFFHPTLQHLGEEAVFGKEVNFVDGTAAPNNNTVFGYQERYYDYRYMPSFITGKMKSGVTGSLDVWTLAQNFGNDGVVLSSEFIQYNTDMDRVVAVPSEPVFYVDVWHRYHHTRPMAVRSIPGLTRL